MNRNTDVSRLRPTPVEESAETGTPSARCAAAVERATALLVRGMQEADSPILQLSDALARMAQTLTDIGTPLFGQAATEPAAAVPQRLRDAFKHDIAVCIESLQCHDRLMQQLVQARDILIPLTANPLARVANATAASHGNIELF
jgi:hypothetical protein